MTNAPTLTNWARNVTYRPGEHVAPRSIDELLDVIRGARRAKAMGSGHSFNRIADTDGVLISTRELPSAAVIDRGRGVVRVPAGLRYGDLAVQLEREGLALANLASLPHISVAGAVATGTHGSGDAVPPLSGAVRAVELATSDGELRTIGRGDSDFAGAVVSLGALGVVTALDVEVVDTFEVAQTVYEGVAVEALLENLSGVTGEAYSTSIFTTWRDPDAFGQVWLKRRADDPRPLPETLLAAARATRKVHPLPGVSPDACTPQLGEPGPWHERLPHFLLAFTPSSGDELQSEYFVDRSVATGAIAAVRGMAERIAPLLQVAEMRTMAGERQWLSPTRGRDTVALHFTWVADQPAVEALLPDLESALAPFEARPHWGKLFATRRDRLAELYPRVDEFVALRERLDPRRVFANGFLTGLGLAD
jgi:xylitol oxidase